MEPTRSSSKGLYIVIGAMVTVLIVLSVVYYALSNRHKQTGGPETGPTSTPVPPEVEAQRMQQQAVSDNDFGKRVLDREVAYPWLDQLPFKTPDYFLYFDVDDKKFHGTIYAKADRADAVKATAVTALQRAKIPYQKYQIVWTTQAK